MRIYASAMVNPSILAYLSDRREQIKFLIAAIAVDIVYILGFLLLGIPLAKMAKSGLGKSLRLY